ncbi:unnamed protein product, partial [Adineta ricciae]
MANSFRRSSSALIPPVTSHCHRCQLDIESDPQCNGRLRILCPFCGEFLTGSNLPDIQQLKKDIQKRARDDSCQDNASLRSRFSRTFNRVILRRPDLSNNSDNNEVTTNPSNNKVHQNVKMPLIGNKQQQANEQMDKENIVTTSTIHATTVAQVKIYDREDFQNLMADNNSTKDQIYAFFSRFYINFDYMLQTLTLAGNTKEIDWKYLQLIHDFILKDIHKLFRLVLKTIASCCIREVRASESTLTGYVILILAPVFDEASNNHIFAHVLRRVAHFNDRQHQEIVSILKTLPDDMFRSAVRRLQAFISLNVFPSRMENSASALVNGWWIPCGIRTLALFNRANERGNGRVVPLQEMAIEILNSVDGERDYFEWKHRQSHGIIGGFTFCQYPFVLSVNAKRTILKRDSEQQMIVNARRSMIEKFQNRQAPNLNMLFLNLYIRRAHLVADSLAEVTRKHEDLKKKLRVTFVGENGLDMGGLTKEWFLLLLRQIFQPDYGMFVFYESSGVFWFNGASTDNIREYNLVGILMGLAVYNAIILDIRFPLVCYKKLLTPAFIKEPVSNLSKLKVGLIKPTLADFRTIRPDIAKSLQYLLDYDGNVEDDFGLTFEVSVAQFDATLIYSLKENGSQINVTNDNRAEYVELLIDFYLNKHIAKQFEAFYCGFHSVCSSNALLLLVPEELEMLICGM